MTTRPTAPDAMFSTTAAARSCPRCGEVNHCQQALSPEPVSDCWCMQQSWQRPLTLPETFNRSNNKRHCLCVSCIQLLQALPMATTATVASRAPSEDSGDTATKQRTR